jgi:antitoxin component of MazEF toxin-antitoxin module
MGYPTKIQLISRDKGNQWYVNFPNALAEAMDFAKGETVEWTVLSTTCLQMKRRMDHTGREQKSPKNDRH